MKAGVTLLSLAVLLSALSACRASAPGKIETAMAGWTKHHLTIGGGGEKNPIPATTASIANGRRIFGYYCYVCHGLDGQNTGVPFSDSVSPPIPSLASRGVQRYTDGQLKWIIDNGIRFSGMPASKGTLNEDEIWKIVVYLRHLPPPGSQGDPKAYAGDE